MSMEGDLLSLSPRNLARIYADTDSFYMLLYIHVDVYLF